MSESSGPWDTRNIMRQLTERLRDDGWLPADGTLVRTGEADVYKALSDALDAALAGRATRNAPSPKGIAESVLLSIATDLKAQPLERIRAAGMLLGAGP